MEKKVGSFRGKKRREPDAPFRRAHRETHYAGVFTLKKLREEKGG